MSWKKAFLSSLRATKALKMFARKMFSFSRGRLTASTNKSEWQAWSLWSNCFEKVRGLVFPWKPRGKLVVKKFGLSLTRKVKATLQKFIYAPQWVTVNPQRFGSWKMTIFHQKFIKNCQSSGLRRCHGRNDSLIALHVYEVPAAFGIFFQPFYTVFLLFRRACGVSLNVFWLENVEKSSQPNPHGSLQWCLSISES